MKRPEGMNKPYILGKDGQDRMIRNGWRLMIPQSVFEKDDCSPYHRKETTEEMYIRLSAKYEKVKIYLATTMIRGYYDHFAMVKGRRNNNDI